jgi:hyperosmotically inducible protein
MKGTSECGLLTALCLILSLAVSPPVLLGQEEKKPPDNTATNKQDRNKEEPTADQQKENRSDRELTRQIRRSITKDKSLSTYARNIKVISQDGTVTLKGPVRSAEEKKLVEAKAAEVAGAANVKSELDIAPEKQPTQK